MKPRQKLSSFSDLVYSSGQGAMCSSCGSPVSTCRCDELKKQQVLGNGKVIVGRETSGRSGKGVTTVKGLPLNEIQLKELASKLKQRCGTGGTVKDGVIEIQGEQRDLLIAELTKLGYQPKRSGG